MFNCNICCKVYVWPHDLQRHIRSKHSSDEPLYHPGVTQQQQQKQQQQQQQKQQQKAFVFRHPFTMIVSGPTSCDKTYFILFVSTHKKNCEVLVQTGSFGCIKGGNLFTRKYNEHAVLPRVEFIRGIPFDLERDDFFDPNIRNMILLDDLMSTSDKDSRINDLFTEGCHHRNLSVVVFNQNLYFGKDPTQRRNCHYLILFNNPIDRQPIVTLGRQMYPSRGDFFLRKFEEAKRTPFGYFLVDLKARTPEASRLHTEVLQVGQGETPDGQRDDDRLSNTFEDDSSVSSDEDIADETTHSSSEDAETRKDLIACQDCGVLSVCSPTWIRSPTSARLWE
ncbi:Hypothetical predicted protein [Mytilus galloprovincialis]|uniref:C2H2-type domain-containing protein n=1 Tax=Mytilus galloprovincialis TaxID=29158 RepID=A0A8B6H486_MYTGA|nr:Hypothetical predicted protein [Mytilus galloprovincialis]